MKPFRLCDLPHVVFYQVILEHTAYGLTKLASCSTKMECLLRSLNFYVDEYTVCILDRRITYIQEGPDRGYHCRWFVQNGLTNTQEATPGSHIFSTVETEAETNVRMSLEWVDAFLSFDSGPDMDDHVERTNDFNLLRAFNWIKSLIPVRNNKICWKLDMDIIKPEGLEFVIDHPIFKQSNTIEIKGGSISRRLMKRLIEECTSFYKLRIESSIPQDFCHEYPFSTVITDIRDGYWVTLDNLLRLRGTNLIQLGETNFGFRDIRTLIRVWLENDHDMFYYLSFFPKDLIRFNPDEIIEGFVALKSEQFPPTYSLIQRMCTRKSRPVLRVCIRNHHISFDAVKDGPAAREIRILNELYQKADWEEELRTLLKAMDLMAEQLQRCSPGSTKHRTLIAEIDEHNSKKDGIVRKLNELVRELEGDDVEFLDGQAIIKT